MSSMYPPARAAVMLPGKHSLLDENGAKVFCLMCNQTVVRCNCAMYSPLNKCRKMLQSFMDDFLRHTLATEDRFSSDEEFFELVRRAALDVLERGDSAEGA